MSLIDSAQYKNTTASVQVKAGVGVVWGFIINSHTSGTLKLWDALTAVAPILMNTYTFPAGSSVVIFPQGSNFYTGLFATIGGTADITILYN